MNLDDLYTVIASRKGGNPEQSYTASLFDKGIAKIAQKVGEEAVETVIDGVSGVGALMSIRKPASEAALTVLLPKTAIRVLFCWKSGKFLSRLSMPEGLKNTKTS